MEVAMESFERNGLWWLPEDETKKVAGTLTFTAEDGLRFRTIGGFDEEPFSMSQEDRPVILGISEDRQLVTLVQCLFTSSNFGVPGYQSLHMKPQWAYIGLLRDDPVELVFDSMLIEYANLQAWAGLAPLNAQAESINEGVTRFEVTFDKPPPIAFPAGIGEISLEARVFTPTASDEEYTLRVIPGIRITRDKPLDMTQWMRQAVRPLQDFFSLAANRAVGIRTLFTFAEEFGPLDHKPPFPRAPVQILYDPLYHDMSDWQPSRRGFLFALRDLGDEMGASMSKWLDVYEELRPVVSRFFAQLYRELYVGNRFMDTVMSLEGYHRMRFQNFQLDPHEHLMQVSDILDSVPDEYRNWLERRLEYSNEPPLHRRLRDIIDKVGPIGPELLGNRAARKKFITRVVDARNSLVHLDETPRKHAATDGITLHWLSEKLSWLMKSCLLHEIGLSEEKTAEIVTKHRGFQHVVTLNLEA
jgi:hypothetical protein